MMRKFSAVMGAFQYEFRMQVRRPALWLTIAVVCLVLVRFQHRHVGTILLDVHSLTYSTDLQRAAAWADFINRLLPIVVGVLIADRLSRDHQTRVAELLETTVAPLWARLTGKYLGSTFATLLPIFVFYMSGVMVLLVRMHDTLVVPYALLTFVTIVLPGMMLIAAFSLCCSAFMWWPVYCFLLTGYWFWGNLLSPKDHVWTISETLFTPAGGYMSKGFFGVSAFQIYDVKVTPAQAIECLALLLAVTVCVLFLTCRLLNFRRRK